MSGLVACPFCRQMFERSEARACPECGLALEALAKLPPSHDAQALEPEEPIPPHMQPLPWTYLGRNRALLVVVALLGFACFFAPWLHESAPEIRTLTGFGFARKLGWLWAPAVAFFVMVPLVVTRRSIYRMRGARVAVAFLAGIVLTTACVRIARVPESSRYLPVRIEWGWGLYATGALGLVALALAVGFGGKLDDMPTKERAPTGATLH
ncbi:MAG TPA: hypothetical protein VGM56_05545 [Byssovorax sp.]|jgi:hypothetical protein